MKNIFVRRINDSYRFVLLLVVLSLFELSIHSCASRSAPSGGPRDTLAPVLDTSYPPNYSTQFKAREISLEFNEYVDLRSAQQQLLISPPLKEKPTIEGRGKEVLITLSDSLQANTTYIISFGNSVTDFHEGNVNDQLRYVFSTGTYIDSLELSGKISGAFSGEVPEKLMVGLYDQSQIKSADSFLYKQLPNYYAYLSEEGDFKMTNLRPGQYRLIAFNDKRDDFLLNTGSETMAFWPEAIDLEPDSNYNFALSSFDPVPDFRFYNGRHKSKGKIQFALNRKPDSFQIEPINQPADSAYFKYNKTEDTLNYWFSFMRDSLQFRLNGQGGFKDSIYTISLRDYKAPKLRLQVKTTEIRNLDTVFFTSNLPLRKFVSDSVFLLRNDTAHLVPVINAEDPRQAYFPPPHKTVFTFQFLAGAVRGWFNTKNDSTAYNFKVLRGEDLGTVDFKVKTDSIFQYVLNIYNPKKDLVATRIFEDSTTVQLKNQLPGRYEAYLIQDVNRDGEWTTGNLLENRLPEKRLLYKEELEIRANWEQELIWLVKPD